MARFAPQSTLVRVTKAKKHDIDRWKEGRYLESSTGRTVDELIDRAVADRYGLATQLFRAAESVFSGSPPMYRLAVSRYYYSMYHAMRAAAYKYHGGDDHEEHRTLPGKTPDDMPNESLLGNALKNARERRNAADYDPYPKSDAAWKKDAAGLRTACTGMLADIRNYLKSKLQSMTTDITAGGIVRAHVSKSFSEEGIPVTELLIRDYPDETVVVVQVPMEYLQAAAELGNRLDHELQQRGFQGFVTVRSSELTQTPPKPFRARAGVTDERVANLIALISERARTSEAQPSLHYVRDVAANVARVRARRHNLIFGRRGAGKTALMLEAKRQVLEAGELSVWLNLQTYRRESFQRVVLWVAARICDSILFELRSDSRRQGLLTTIATVRTSVERMLGMDLVDVDQVHRLTPLLQNAIQRFTESTSRRLYVFLDDVHYIQRSEQPDLLDLLHGMVRDADAWLKVAAIRHFSKWYRINPPTGLQAGQDADAIDLDLTLQEPARAKEFLEEVLLGFAQHTGIPTLRGLFAPEALDRLVLASGAVPRDYLVLAGNAIGEARRRERARVVGKQDVATAAGDIAQAKMAELEDDAAAAAGSAQQMILGLQTLRDFCVDEKRYTFFYVDFKDKETKVDEYTLLQSLMDVRLVHILNASISDAHQSGERAEAYMLDSSQFSGARFKKYLKVLDLIAGQLVMRETGTTKPQRVGDTPRKLLTILRTAPQFSLNHFDEIVRYQEPTA